MKVTNHKIANASVFATMMVVGIHTTGRWLGDEASGSMLWFWETWGYFGVFLIAVPFFFLCSGYFLAGHMGEHEWWQHECKKRFHTLLVPYLVWNVAYAFLPLAIFLVANLVHWRFAPIQMDFDVKFWIDTLGLSPFRSPRLYSLWYLRTLMIFVVASPALFHLIKARGVGWLVVFYAASLVIGVWKICAPTSRFVLFFTECFNLQGLFYFCCGIYGRLHDVHVPCHGRFLALAVGFCVIAVSTLGRACFSLNFLPVTRILFVPLFLFGLWHFVPERPLPKWLTGTTFAVYVMHILVFQVIQCVLRMPVETLHQWVAKWAVGFVGSLAIALIMRKFCPRGAKIVFGGRLGVGDIRC